MKKKKKRILVICIIILALIFVVSVISPVFLAITFVVDSSRKIESKKVKLLFESNHEELLLACRKMLLEAKDGKREYGELLFLTKEEKKLYESLPEPLKKIEPVSIGISPDRIMVSLWGGMYHVGIVAFPEGTMPWGNQCHKELIEGLWYYDDRYNSDPDFEEYIESLRPKSQKIDNP